MTKAEAFFMEAYKFLQDKFEDVRIPPKNDDWIDFKVVWGGNEYTFTFRAGLTRYSRTLEDMPLGFNHFLLYYKGREHVFAIVHSFEVHRRIWKNSDGSFALHRGDLVHDYYFNE